MIVRAKIYLAFLVLFLVIPFVSAEDCLFDSDTVLTEDNDTCAYIGIESGVTLTTSTFDITATGDVEVNGTLNATGNGNMSFGSLTIRSGGVYNATSGNTTITSKAGSWSINDEGVGTFIHNDGTLIIETASASLMRINSGNGNINNLIIDQNSAFYTRWGGVHTVDGNLTIIDTLYFAPSSTAYPLTVTGDVLVNDGQLGGLSATGAFTFGSLTINSDGTYDATKGTTTITDETATFALDAKFGTFIHNDGTILITTATDTNIRFTNEATINNFAINTASIVDSIGQSAAVTNVLGDVVIDGGGELTLIEGTPDIWLVTGALNITNGTFNGGTDDISFGSLKIDENGTYEATSGITTLTGTATPFVYELVEGGTFTHNDGLMRFDLLSAEQVKANISGTNAFYDLEILSKRLSFDNNPAPLLCVEHDLIGSNGQIRLVNNMYKIILGTSSYASQVSLFSLQGADKDDQYWEAFSEDYPANITSTSLLFLISDTTLAADNTHLKWLNIENDIIQSGGSKVITIDGDVTFYGLNVHADNTFNVTDVAVANFSSAFVDNGNFTLDGNMSVFDSDINVTENVIIGGIMDASNATSTNFGSLTILQGGEYITTAGTTNVSGDLVQGGTFTAWFTDIWARLIVLGDMFIDTVTSWMGLDLDTSNVYINGTFELHDSNHTIASDLNCTNTTTYNDTALVIDGDLHILGGCDFSLINSTINVTGNAILYSNGNFTGGYLDNWFGSLEIQLGGLHNATNNTTTIIDENPAGYSLYNDGTFTANSGLVNITSEESLIDLDGSGNLYDLVSSSPQKTKWTVGDITIDNDLTIEDGGFYPHSAWSQGLTVVGNVIVKGSLGHNSWTGEASFGSLTIESGGTYLATSGITTVTGTGLIDGTYLSSNNGFATFGDTVSGSGTVNLTGGDFNVTGADDDITVKFLSANNTMINVSDIAASTAAGTQWWLLEQTNITCRRFGSATNFDLIDSGESTITIDSISSTDSIASSDDDEILYNVIIKKSAGNWANFGSNISIANTLNVTTELRTYGFRTNVSGDTEVSHIFNTTQVTENNDIFFADLTINGSGTFEPTNQTTTFCHIYNNGSIIDTNGTWIQSCSPVAPVAVSPINQLFNYLSGIWFEWTYAEWSPLYRLIVWLSGDSANPVINISTNDTFYNYTGANLTEGQYFWNATPETDGLLNESTTASFKLDITQPTITFVNPSEFLGVIQYFKTTENVILNISNEDDNLYGSNISCTNSTGDSVFFDETVNITGGSWVWDNDTGTHPSGNYSCEDCAVDDHTDKELSEDATATEIDKGYKYKIQQDNAIEIYLSSKHNTKTITNTKRSDRFTSEYILEDGENCADGCSFTYKSDKPYYLRDNSGYKAHFVSGLTWSDFEADFYDSKGKQINDAIYEITGISDKKAEITIYSEASRIVFKSIGGVNLRCKSQDFRVNTIPTIDGINIYDGSTNYTNEDLTCNMSLTDNDPEQTFTVSFEFYNATDMIYDTTESCTNGTNCQTVLDSSYTVKNENYWCSVVVYDLYEYSTDSNSSNISILNVPPTAPALNYPIEEAWRYNNSVVVFSWNASTDVDSDQLTYHLQIYNESTVTTILNASYNQSALAYTVDVNDFQQGYDRVYWWRVIADDQETNSSWSDVGNFTYWEAGGNCTYITLDASEPLNKKYTYTTALPYNFETTVADDCQYTVTDGIENFTINCNGDGIFDVDFDQEYNMTFSAVHVDTGGYCEQIIVFEVDRSGLEEAKGIVVAAVIFGLLVIAGIIIFISSFLDHKFKAIVYFTAWAFVMISLNVIMVSAREYIKVPAITNLLTTGYMVLMYITYFIGLLIGAMFMINLFRQRQHAKKQKKEGEDY